MEYQFSSLTMEFSNPDFQEFLRNHNIRTERIPESLSEFPEYWFIGKEGDLVELIVEWYGNQEDLLASIQEVQEP